MRIAAALDGLRVEARPSWADGVQVVDADFDGTWELPVFGEVTAPSAVLTRPDEHVAWVGGRRR